MLQSRPFRFGVVGLGAHSRAEWVTLARKAEGLGYAVFVMPDHFQPQLAPMTALMAVADATHVLRIGSFVFANDFRHPAVLAKEAATLDFLSDGRFELGIGAGWAAPDYTTTGMPFDPPGTRIRRLSEAIQVVKGLFSAELVTFVTDPAPLSAPLHGRQRETFTHPCSPRSRHHRPHVRLARVTVSSG